MLRLHDYIKLAFRNCFPRTGKIAVAFQPFNETWIVAVDDARAGLHIYTMVVGSDDEEFRFACLTDALRPDVAFPLPEDAS